MASKSDVVIVGAGIVGLTLALALANEGFSVLLVEAKTQKQLKKNSSEKASGKSSEKSSANDNSALNAAEQPDIRAIALAQTSWERLADLLSPRGRERLLANSSPIWDMRIVEAHPLRGVDTRKIHLSHKDLMRKKTRTSAKNTETADVREAGGNTNEDNLASDPLGSIVEGQVLLDLLYDDIAEHKSIEVRLATRLLDFAATPAAIDIVLQEVQGLQEARKAQPSAKIQAGKIQAGLLLACDGKNSQIRERASITCRKKDYRQSALVCSLEHQRAHGGVAVEWFTPNGTFASLPLLGQRSGIVWCDKQRRIERLVEIDEQEFLKHARVRFGAWLGEIKLASKRVSYPIGLSHARKYVAQRIALLGDAAHAIHPLAGQGLNLGLRDVFELLKLLKEARYLGQDIGDGDMLARYEKARKYDARKLICITDGLNSLFSNDSTALRQLRLTGMAMIDRLPFAKKAIVRAAI